MAARAALPCAGWRWMRPRRSLGAGLSLLFTPGTGVLAFLLALFCGFFLHIGASGLLPESHRAYPRPTTTLATLAGAAFLYAVTTLVQ